MWIRPDYTGTFEELTEEVKTAIANFEQDKSDGMAKPVGDEMKF